MQALRRREQMTRYFELLPAAHHEHMRSIIAGVWLPIDAVLAHYRTMQALFPTQDEQVALGREVGDRMHQSILSTVAKLAVGIGATPWTGFRQVPKLWERTFVGGGMAIQKLGPKEALVEVVKLPLVSVPYFRTGFRGLLIGNCEGLSRGKAYVTELRLAGDTVSFRASWV